MPTSSWLPMECGSGSHMPSTAAQCRSVPAGAVTGPGWLQADKEALEEELAAAQQRCQSAEEADKAGLQSMQVSKDESEELRRQLQEARCRLALPVFVLENAPNAPGGGAHPSIVQVCVPGCAERLQAGRIR